MLILGIFLDTGSYFMFYVPLSIGEIKYSGGQRSLPSMKSLDKLCFCENESELGATRWKKSFFSAFFMRYT